MKLLIVYELNEPITLFMIRLHFWEEEKKKNT